MPQPCTLALDIGGISAQAPRWRDYRQWRTIRKWVRSDLRGPATHLAGVPRTAHEDVRRWAHGGEHLIGAGPHTTGSQAGFSTSPWAPVWPGRSWRIPGFSPAPTATAGAYAEIVCADYAGRADRCENIAATTDLTLHGIMGRWQAGEELARTIFTGNLTGFGEGRALRALVTLLDLTAVVIGPGNALITAARYARDYAY